MQLYLCKLNYSYEIIIFSVLAVEMTSFGNRGAEVLVISFNSSAISSTTSGIKATVKSLSSARKVLTTRVFNSSALISNLICSTVLHCDTFGASQSPFWLHNLVVFPKGIQGIQKHDYKICVASYIATIASYVCKT